MKKLTNKITKGLVEGGKNIITNEKLDDNTLVSVKRSDIIPNEDAFLVKVEQTINGVIKTSQQCVVRVDSKEPAEELILFGIDEALYDLKTK